MVKKLTEAARPEGQKSSQKQHALMPNKPIAARPDAKKPMEAARPEGAEALSPGQRPGYNVSQQCAL